MKLTNEYNNIKNYLFNNDIKTIFIVCLFIYYFLTQNFNLVILFQIHGNWRKFCFLSNAVSYIKVIYIENSKKKYYIYYG